MQSTIYDKVFPVLEATLSQIDYIPFWAEVGFKHLNQEESSIFLSVSQTARYSSSFTKSNLPMEQIFLFLQQYRLFLSSYKPA